MQCGIAKLEGRKVGTWESGSEKDLKHVRLHNSGALDAGVVASLYSAEALHIVLLVCLLFTSVVPEKRNSRSLAVLTQKQVCC
jgi:hypothetical protein